MKLLLTEWAEKNYRTPPPLFTLRKWARNGEFWPPASKDGKHWYVDENAVRLCHDANAMTLVQRMQA